MHSRAARIFALAAFAALLASCGPKLVFNKSAYDGVKKVAVVQYAVNPGGLLGATNANDVQKAVAEANLKNVVEKLSGLGYEIIPIDQVKANEAYQKFAAE